MSGWNWKNKYKRNGLIFRFVECVIKLPNIYIFIILHVETGNIEKRPWGKRETEAYYGQKRHTFIQIFPVSQLFRDHELTLDNFREIAIWRMTPIAGHNNNWKSVYKMWPNCIYSVRGKCIYEKNRV